MQAIWNLTARAAIGLALMFAIARAEAPRLEITVEATDHPGPLPPEGTLDILITNPVDSIAGFSIWVQTDRPDIIRFLPLAVLSEQSLPTATLIRNWEYVYPRFVAADSSTLRMTALAEGNFQPPINRGFGPSATPRVLFRVPYQIVPGTDSMASATVRVTVNTELPRNFDFSTPVGLTIPAFDTVGGIPVLDTLGIKVLDDSIHIGHCTCMADGDINGDGVGLSVGDLVNTLRTLDGMIDPPDSLCHVDFNGDCAVDTADASLYMRYFDSGVIIFGWPPLPRPTCCHVALKICCQGRSGNVDCDPEDRTDISDIAMLIDNLYISMTPLCCFGEANVDGDPGRTVDIADLSALIDYLYISYTPPKLCF